MFKMLAIAGLAALVTACAAPPSDTAAAGDQARPARGSTAGGEATAAGMGFHGPVYRANKTDGPN